jgi:hypothetical protein
MAERFTEKAKQYAKRCGMTPEEALGWILSKAERGSSPSDVLPGFEAQSVDEEEYVVQGKTEEGAWTDIETWEADKMDWNGFETPEEAQKFCDEVRNREDLYWKDFRIVRRASIEEVVRP